MIIQADNIKDGMVLQEPILNSYGFVLVPSGYTLTEKHVKLLKTWNIKLVNVISEEEKDAENFSDELLESARILVKEKIKWEARNEYEEIILQQSVLAIARLIKRNKL